MFDFQQLEVYKKSKQFYVSCQKLMQEQNINNYAKDQLSRASFSIALNIAEGSGKFSKYDRRNYFTTARASVFECVAILDILSDEGKISPSKFNEMAAQADELSRILYTMIKNLS